MKTLSLLKKLRKTLPLLGILENVNRVSCWFFCIQTRGIASKLQRNSKSNMDAYTNLNLQDNFLQSISDEATDWANVNGVVMKSNSDEKLNNFAPFTLFPSPFPEYLYKEAFEVEKHFQTLMHKASQDHDFLENCLKGVLVHDEFTKKLYDIYLKVREEGIKQPICLEFIRSDYMLDDKGKQQTNGCHGKQQTNGFHGKRETNGFHGTPAKAPRQFEITQVEVNMIAASFGCLGSLVGKLHSHLADVIGDDCPYKKEKLPDNSPTRGMGKGLADAWKLYGNDDAVVLFVVQEGEKNRYDQRLLQYSFQERIKEQDPKKFVPVVFKSLQEVYKEGKLTEDHRLIVNGKEVAVAYFRAGYAPADFPTEICWSARLLIERSLAIKSPNIASHLVGSKKIQQVFGEPGTVERFIKDPDIVQKIRRTFAGLYSLDQGVEGDRVAKMALAQPERYVLKPQREGGGNNHYGEELVSVLKSIKDPVERSQYILMDLISPPVYKNYIVHVDFDRPRLLDVVNEIGVFGVLLRNGDEEIFNEAVGYLVRTKSIEHADGGVAAGRAVLDSINLF